MRTDYTPSVNIIRDYDRSLNYQSTPNGERAANKIVNDFRLGKRSFTLIGSYGTGKSSFLWALEQSILSKKHYYKALFLDNPKIEIINIVGEYKSISTYLADYFEIEKGNYKKLFAEIFNRYRQLGKDSGLLLLVIDEFGKFLEYAAKHSPENELYFLQQLAEFINNPDHNIILLTSVHQNLDAYAAGLSDTQRQEWTKIKGRFEEITFNEPVEQLIYLASEQLSRNSDFHIDDETIDKANTVFLESKIFKVNDEFRTKVSRKIYPLDMISAYTLTLALQRYGQNERSLFSFLTNTDYSGLFGYDRRSNPFYNLANVYDYLIFNFYNHLNSQNNADLRAWLNIKDALERIEDDFEFEYLHKAQKIIKTVGLLNIFASKSAVITPYFLRSYASHCLGLYLKEATEIIDSLEQKKILRYREYSKRFVVFEGTDVDFHSLLLSAANNVGTINDISSLINQYFDFSPVFAKSHYYKTGTPRIFEYVISSEPKENLLPQGETDGYINLIFNDTLDRQKLQDRSKNQQEAVIYGHYTNSKEIKDLLFEIEKTKKAIELVPVDDKIAHRELREIKQGQEESLNLYITANLFSPTNDVLWIYQGKICNIQSQKEFNKKLSDICLNVYDKAPIYRNELVNRHRLPPPIFTAKRVFLQHLTRNSHVKDIGFDENKFPPEKTIFITLLKQNGLITDPNHLSEPITLNKESEFQHLWNLCEEFLNSTKKNRRRISELVKLFQNRPFKIKQGLIDFWLPSFLFIKSNDFALFQGNRYIADINPETLELINKAPDDFEIKAFDIAGVRLDIFNGYRTLLNQSEVRNAGNLSFIETIKPFLTFYRGLDDYVKNTKRLSKETLAVRDAVANAKDPEKTFFEDFPQALGFSVKQLQEDTKELEKYVSSLQDSIRELRTCSHELVNRFETFICNEVLYQEYTFEEYQKVLQNRFLEIKKHLLIPSQKTFLMRLESVLDERASWLSSITQAVIGKNLTSIKDEDEFLLYDKFKSMITDLDNLTILSKAQHNEEKEYIYKFEITTFGSSSQKIIKVPKQKTEEIDKIESALKKQLGKDITLNIAA